MGAVDPELAAALASVAEGPGDQGRRRVLGDLLLERGDPRGEFLLLQFLIAENQASGATRQRAAELWRTHKREWMAGADRLLTRVKLDRGFPVEAELRRGATPAMLSAALGSPMLATLRSLGGAGEAIVEAVAAPRLRELRQVTFHQRLHFAQAAVRGVKGRLTALQLGFELGGDECELLLHSPVFSNLIQLSVRGSPTPDPNSSRWVRLTAPAKLGSMAGLLGRLSAHPNLERVRLTGDAFGDHRRYAELAPVWPRLEFLQLTVPGSFELTREGEATVLTLQNLSMKELIGLRPLVPPGTVRVLLMPKRELWDDGTLREKLLSAYAGLSPKTLP